MKATMLLLLGGCLLAGCAPLDVENARRQAAPVAVDELLFFSDRLATATADELAAMPARRPARVGEPGRALRHALWLATPGHSGTDMEAARALLEQLVTRTDGLDAPSRALVRLQLRHLRERMELASANARLHREAERLREQLRALTALEREMGGDESGSDNGDLGGGSGE